MHLCKSLAKSEEYSVKSGYYLAVRRELEGVPTGPGSCFLPSSSLWKWHLELPPQNQTFLMEGFKEFVANSRKPLCTNVCKVPFMSNLSKSRVN